MISHDAFLAEILAHPDDDGPRLIYADWLEEQGDVRAEFIRIQCALWGMETHHPEFSRLRRREQAFLRKHKSEWLGPIEAMTFEAKFYRGLVREITVGARQFLQHQEALFRLAPIQQVNLSRLTSATSRETADCANLRRITALRLAAGELAGEEVSSLFASTYWTNLNCLRVRGDMRFAFFAPLLYYVRELGVQELILEGGLLGGFGAQAFAEVLGNGRLRRLDLSSAGIGPQGARRLAGSRWIDNLRELHLAYNAIGDEGLYALAQSPMMQSLELLDLTHNELRDFGLRELFGNLAKPGLKSLTLAQNRLPALMFALFPDIEGVRNLEHLDLSHVAGLTPLNIGRMIESLSLTTLKLYRCRIGDASAIALAKSPRSASLRLLDLNDNRLGDAAADAILDAPYLANLTRLDLRNNAIGRDRRRALRRRFGAGVCMFSR